MTEADVISLLVEFMHVLLAGITIYFSIVSAYIAGLYMFLARAHIFLKLVAFLFFSLIFFFLMQFNYGAGVFQRGLVDTLAELQASGVDLSAAGETALESARAGLNQKVRTVMWLGSAATYAALFYLTFFHNWRFLMGENSDEAMLRRQR
ncbi:hypothetical protein V0U79_01000 [Hyphobacterium sp. HN65]|uniref:Uncharacterized protein n=1 Tax=Hyphobacterium lacteum TaxID=3116575 RepID=A0ABU7LLX2_9PROT|nr:hypothetical protein [Hyphobacterium sp. HN65]MEE2524928.1 hypothetical protein [Hyphobacterium sp. HN65]